MYCDRSRLGHFAAAPAKFTCGDGPTLFRLLIASAMFQRRTDQRVFQFLRGLTRAQVADLSDPHSLLSRAKASPCQCLHGLGELHGSCDLTKQGDPPVGACRAAPGTRCPPKRHTVLLRRYPDFGKMPSSAALALYDRGEGGLARFYREVTSVTRDRRARGALLLQRVRQVWRIDVKIASMFLAALTNPDLGGPRPPWAAEIEFTDFIVIDSNVDRFLGLLGVAARGASYDARRRVVLRVAERTPLDEMKPGLRPFNPRLVQQAMYVFMNASNRQATPTDCMHAGEAACRTCDRALVRFCPVAAGRRRGAGTALR